jgi:hypothetical protein
MTLTRHSQVENLANLLRLRRRHAARADQREQAYRQLVAAILDVPVDRILAVMPRPAPTTVQLRRPHTRAA